MGLENRLAHFISLLFHPLLMPTYAFCIVLFTDNYISTFIPVHLKYMIGSITFLFTFLLPVINAFILLKTGRIKSLKMETNEERLIPFGSGIMYYTALLFLFHKANFLNIFQFFILGSVICILFTLLINIKWKISAHGMGIGGLTGTILCLIYKFHLNVEFFFLISILTAGCVAYSRLKLNAHSPSQVYVGLFLGFFIQFFILAI